MVAAHWSPGEETATYVSVIAKQRQPVIVRTREPCSTFHMDSCDGFIGTFSGLRFWPLLPNPADILIADIAHALAHQCRFGGHASKFYSVAEHSVHVSQLCLPEHALGGLLHDASEAYLVDLPRPLKQLPEFVPYREAERRLQRAVAVWFGLPEDQPASVTEADDTMLWIEARSLLDSAAVEVIRDMLRSRNHTMTYNMFQAAAPMNMQALTLTHNRDGDKLRLAERILLAACRRVEAAPLAVATVSYTLDNALDYARRTIPRFLERIQGKTVLDYGCGPGWQAVAMRRAGASSVHGIDINDEWLSHGRDLAARAGVDGVIFGKATSAEKYDIVLSLGAMEHFGDPCRELARMCSMTREELVISFAEPWYSPYGTHLNGTTKLPWLNLWFSERTLLNVRNLYPDGSDGAKRFEDIRGGLNKMTVRRFEQAIRSAPGMRVEHLILHGVKRVPLVTRVPVLRELMTGALTCILKPRG